MPLLGEIFVREDAAVSIAGGVDGNAGKSSSSRPGGFGCSEAKLFLKESGELWSLYGLVVSSTGSVESERTCDDDGIDVSMGGGVKTRLAPGDESKDEGGGTIVDVLGTVDAVAAATAANSSSAFRIRSRSLRLLSVLLLSFEISSDVFSD